MFPYVRPFQTPGRRGIHRGYTGTCQIRGVSDSTASVQNNVGFSNDTWTVNIIDANSNVLIAQHTVTLTGGGTPSPYPVYPGFTAEAWVNWYTNPSSGAQYATIVVNGSNDYNRNYQLQVTDNKFELAIATFDHGSGGIWISSPKTLTDYNLVPGTWYYVTGVYNQTPGTMAIFVNGLWANQQNVDSSGLRPTPGPSGLQWGGTQGIKWGYPVVIDGQRIFNGIVRGNTYDRALSLTEIQDHAKTPPS